MTDNVNHLPINYWKFLISEYFFISFADCWLAPQGVNESVDWGFENKAAVTMKVKDKFL